MGTRCDFYTVDDSKKLVWVGSYGWDGDPGGVQQMMGIEKSTRQEDYVSKIIEYLKENDGYIAGEHGWPWPWNDSCTTDHYYIFYKRNVYVGAWGGCLVEINTFLKNSEEENIEKYCASIKFDLPDMSAIKKVDLGKSSGVIVFGSPTKRMTKEEFQGKLNELCDEYGKIDSYKIKYKDEDDPDE